MSTLCHGRGGPWVSLGGGFSVRGEDTSGTGGEAISNGKVLGLERCRLQPWDSGPGNVVWDAGLGDPFQTGTHSSCCGLPDCKPMKTPRPVVIRPTVNRMVYSCTWQVLVLVLVEVLVQMGPVSDEQLPGLWNNLWLMSPRKVCALDLIPSPKGWEVRLKIYKNKLRLGAR